MKTKILVFGASEEYADQISKMLRGVTLRRVYFLDEALEAVKKDTPDIIVLHLSYEVKAIFQLRIGGFRGFIIADGPYNYFSEIAGCDIKTIGMDKAANIVLEIAGKVRLLLNRRRKRRQSLIRDIDHYVGMGLTRFEVLMFLLNPGPRLAMKIAKAKVR